MFVLQLKDQRFAKNITNEKPSGFFKTKNHQFWRFFVLKDVSIKRCYILLKNRFSPILIFSSCFALLSFTKSAMASYQSHSQLLI